MWAEAEARGKGAMEAMEAMVRACGLQMITPMRARWPAGSTPYPMPLPQRPAARSRRTKILNGCAYTRGQRRRSLGEKRLPRCAAGRAQMAAAASGCCLGPRASRAWDLLRAVQDGKRSNATASKNQARVLRP